MTRTDSEALVSSHLSIPTSLGAITFALMASLWPGLSTAQSALFTTAGPGVQQTLQRTAAVEAELRCPTTAPAPGLRLSEAVHRALCTDPRTRASWAAVQGQQAEVLLRRAGRWPSATANVELGRGTQRERLTDGGTARSMGSTSGSGWQVQWVLWDFGLRSSQESAAEQTLMAAAASHDQTLQQTLLQVVQAYLTVAEAQAAVKLNRDSERFTRELLAESKRPSKSEEAKLDLLGEKQARTALWRKVLDLRRSEGELARARGELASLMGQPVHMPFTVEPPRATDNNTSIDSSLLELVDSAIQAYPPLREAVARQAAAQAEMQEAQRSDRPVVVAQAGQQRLRSATVLGQSDRNIGLRVDIPLSSWNERRHRVQRAQAQLDVATEVQRQTRKDVELDVWFSYQNLRENAAALRMAERFRLSAEDLLKAELLAFREGDSDMFDVLDADSSRSEAALAELSSLTALNLARARLAASMGQLARLQLPSSLNN